MRAARSTCSSLPSGLTEAHGAGARDHPRHRRRRWRAAAAVASTRAASSSTTRSRRCTRRCAAPIRTPRSTGCAACSMAAAIRSTSRGASCAWRSRTSVLPIRARFALTLDAWEAYERLGSPEGELAHRRPPWSISPCAPKSNAVYVAMGEAMEDVEKFGTLEVPLRLRNAPTRLMKDLGYGRDYRYAHDEPDAFAAGERYLPESMPDRRYYRPAPRGLEMKIGEALARLRARDESQRLNNCDRSEAAAHRSGGGRPQPRAPRLRAGRGGAAGARGAAQALAGRGRSAARRAQRQRQGRRHGQGARRGRRAAHRPRRGADAAGSPRPRRELDARAGGARAVAARPAEPAARVGAGRRDESANVEVRRWGEPRQLRLHSRAITSTLGEHLRGLDFEAAARISGARFVVMRGAGRAAAPRARAVHARSAHARARLHRSLRAVPGAARRR